MSEIVSVRDLSKRYKLYRQPWNRVIERLTAGRASRSRGLLGIGRSVSFEVARGECLGIIGANGAGKSTLLKILARALCPAQGEFEVKGRIVSLLELGTGFHPELTGRKNIFESARLLGFPEAEVRDRLPAILDFAEIGEFIDRPVKQYPSGMFVRPAFSLLAHLDPDVYIVDEALSVGDVFFQQKCFARFRALRERGCTILLVSHDMEAITYLCDRAVVLHACKCASDGDARSAAHDYFALMGQATGPRAAARLASAATDTPMRSGWTRSPGRCAVSWPALCRGPRVTRAIGGARSWASRCPTRSGDPDGRRRRAVRLRFWYLIEAHAAIDDLNMGIHFYDRRGILAFAVGSANRAIALPRLDPGERPVCAVSVTLSLALGEYALPPQVGGLTGEVPEVGVLHDRLESLPPVVVTRAGFEGLPRFYGLTDLPVEFEWSAGAIRPGE